MFHCAYTHTYAKTIIIAIFLLSCRVWKEKAELPSLTATVSANTTTRYRTKGSSIVTFTVRSNVVLFTTEPS